MAKKKRKPKNRKAALLRVKMACISGDTQRIGRAIIDARACKVPASKIIHTVGECTR